MRSIIKYFYFNKRERLALLVFLFLLLLINLSFRFFENEAKYLHYDHPEFQADWIAIDSVEQQPKIHTSKNPIQPSKTMATQVPLVNINLADSFAYKKLPGIGVKYSSRIVRYRNLLGGFYAKEQLLEVYGIDSALFNRISSHLLLGNYNLRKMNVNVCGEKDLSAHPYVSYKLAKLIVKYREHHGRYSSLEELKTIPLIDEQLFRKIVLYLKLE
ncbi:MAG: helix-hairpin-helix domain-containing protein [Flavobacteriales bacterium]|nr:helix-hairpin-helix domain-containing protein [Flavobacteriales bacterium]